MDTSVPLRTAEIVAVGSELLGTTRVDTNSLYLSGQLAAIGIQLRGKSVVGDDRAALANVVRGALERADLIILTGGLGPTDDDVTREAVADVLGVAMHEDAATVERIRERFARRGLRMPEINRKQAMVPEGGAILPNPLGSAPGLLIEHGRRMLILLPGPPRELQPMFEGVVERVLKGRTDGARVFQAVLFVVGRSESHVDEIAFPIYSPWKHAPDPIETTILAGPGQIELHLALRSNDPDAAERRLADARMQLAEAVGNDVFSVDGRPMERIVGDLLAERRWTIAAAESCTGGLLLSRLTDVAGSSTYVIGGCVAYSNESKSVFADVPADLIGALGAVSEPVAAAMAEGIRTRLGTDVGVGITGIAGPSGGSAQKPVGTVAIAVVGPGGLPRVRTVWLPGARTQVKFNATQTALDMVRRLALSS